MMLHFDCFADILLCAAQGLIFIPNAYLSSNWNRMDSVVLLFAWIDELGTFESGSSAKVRLLLLSTKYVYTQVALCGIV